MEVLLFDFLSQHILRQGEFLFRDRELVYAKMLKLYFLIFVL